MIIIIHKNWLFKYRKKNWAKLCLFFYFVMEKFPEQYNFVFD